MPEKVLIGKIAHYFSKIGVAVIELSAPLSLGDTISIEGPTTSYKQKVESMQIEHKPITEAEAGQSVGMKVDEKVREGDQVFIEK
ncbi:MAG: translation elongation factor-like protein [Candidatus Aenigmarchaeota archaeon]|nr:translation elongation factor-like protein [Candidatus Aenigmarchaeota archaeon]